MALLGRAAWIPAALPALLAPIAWISEDFLAISILFGSQIAMALWAVALFLPPLVAWVATTRSSGRLRATFDGEVLSVGSLRLRASELAMAWTRRPVEVEIVTHDGDELRVTFVHAEDARALVAAVRRANDGRRAYPLRLEGDGLRLWRKVWAWLLPLSLATPFLWSGPELGLPALAIGAAIGWLGGRGTKRMRFGADGVSVEGRFRRRALP